MLAKLLPLLDDAPAYAGAFETHLTVAPLDVAGLARFEATCVAFGVKCVRIELARGQTTSQPMTGSQDVGTAQEALRRAVAFAERLQECGFLVTRVKIEASPTNDDIPQTNTQAKGLSETNYYEHHIKLLVTEGLDLAPLIDLISPYQAHLSRNVFRRREDGWCERFVTLRGHGVGRIEATARVESLLAELRQAGFTIVKTVAEYCFFDSNEQIDAGWLTE